MTRPISPTTWKTFTVKSGYSRQGYKISSLRLALSATGCSTKCSITLSLHPTSIQDDKALPDNSSTVGTLTMDVKLDANSNKGTVITLPISPTWNISANTMYTFVLKTSASAMNWHAAPLCARPSPLSAAFGWTLTLPVKFSITTYEKRMWILPPIMRGPPAHARCFVLKSVKPQRNLRHVRVCTDPCMRSLVNASACLFGKPH